MLNQDADRQLASLKLLKIKQVKIDRQQAIVTCVLSDHLRVPTGARHEPMAD
ncbi:hypothetical protein GCM10028819_09920 [Spirosoma humi]